MVRHKTSTCAFTRKRKLGFKEILVNLMGFSRASVQTELDRFYKSLAGRQEAFETVSKSAFTQSRKKVNYKAFIELADRQLSYFYQTAANQRLWKGLRVVAIDGSLLNLPHTDAIEKAFGSVANQHEKVVSARCSLAYDVLNELVLNAAIAPRRSCEKELALEHFEHLNPHTDLLVFDRGYPSQWMVGLLLKKGFRFCFRLSTAWKKATLQLQQGKSDIDWTMVHNTHKMSDYMKKNCIPKRLEGLRLVSVKLPSGENETLLTNLTDRQQYSLQTVSQLYQMRWGVEEAYKTFKKTLHIEHFSGRSVQSIKQDFYARILMLNTASMIRTQAIESMKSKTQTHHKIKANKTQVLAKLKDFLAETFCLPQLEKAVEQMLRILVKRLEVCRPNRTFNRPKTASRRRMKIMNHKGI